MTEEHLSISPIEDFESKIFVMIFIYIMVFSSNFLLDIISSWIGGPEFVGVIKLIKRWGIIIATILQLGIVSTLPKFIAENKSGNYFKISFFLLTTESIFLIILGILLYYIIPYAIFIPVEYGLIFASAQIFHGILYAFSRGQEKIKSMFILQFSLVVIRLIFFTIFLIFKLETFFNIILSFAIIPIISLLMCIPFLNIFEFIKNKNKQNNKISFIFFIKFSAPIYLSSILAIFIAQLDTIFLTFFFPLYEIGLYLVGVSLIGMLNIINNSINVLLLPKVSKYNSNKENIIDLIKKSINFLLILYIPLMLIFLIVPDVIINILYGPNYTELTFNTIKILIFSALFSQISNILIEAIIGLNKPKYRLISYILSFFIKFGLIYLFIIFFYIYGLIFGVFFSQIIEFIIIFYLFKKTLKFQFNDDKIYIKNKSIIFWSSLFSLTIILFSISWFIVNIYLRFYFLLFGIILILIIYFITGKIKFILKLIK